jgi:glutamate carboxypeptidase
MGPMAMHHVPGTSAFTDALRALVEAESPSDDPEAVATAQRTLVELARPLVDGSPEREGADDAAVITWRRGDPADPARILVLGHVDTVWQRGTIRTRPFSVQDGRATGPGVFDMKAGLLVGLHSLRALDPDLPVSLMVTADEEIGSAASRQLILDEAARAQAVLVLEGAGPGGALKSARKGWSIYHLRLRGVAAHAGLEPEKGRNALVRMASLVRRLAELDGQVAGRSVNPTKARAGTTVNTIPDLAELSVDVRAREAADQHEVDRFIRGFEGADDTGVDVRVHGGINRPPMERAMAQPLLDRVRRLDRQEAAEIEDVAVGGISDANLTASAGVPTLDGLGAVGGGAHADDEWIDVDATIRRVPLLTHLVEDLVRNPLESPATTDTAQQTSQRRT